MKKTLVNPTTLKDTVYSVAINSGASDEYAKGIMVGAVGALCATGMTFEDALTHVAICSPEPSKMRPTIKIIPESWVAPFVREYLASHK